MIIRKILRRKSELWKIVNEIHSFIKNSKKTFTELVGYS